MTQKSSYGNTVLLKLNRIDYDQDTMASIIDKSIGPVSVEYGNKVNNVTKENIHLVDINQCNVEVKLNSNDEYFIQNHNFFNVLSKGINLEIQPNTKVIRALNKYDNKLNHDFSSGSGSSSLSYGLNLI